MGITLENVANVEMLPMPMLPVPIGSVGSDPRGRGDRITELAGLKFPIADGKNASIFPLAMEFFLGEEWLVSSFWFLVYGGRAIGDSRLQDAVGGFGDKGDDGDSP